MYQPPRPSGGVAGPGGLVPFAKRVSVERSLDRKDVQFYEIEGTRRKQGPNWKSTPKSPQAMTYGLNLGHFSS